MEDEVAVKKIRGDETKMRIRVRKSKIKLVLVTSFPHFSVTRWTIISVCKIRTIALPDCTFHLYARMSFRETFPKF